MSCPYPTYNVRLRDGRLAAANGIIPTDREIEWGGHLQERSWADLDEHEQLYWRVSLQAQGVEV